MGRNIETGSEEVPGPARGGQPGGACAGCGRVVPRSTAETDAVWCNAGRRRRSLTGSQPRDHGFTIIELLVVITILVILASMGMVSYRNSVVRAREAVLKEDLFRMRDAIDQFHADKGKYPTGLEELVTESYLREIPEDPITRSRETWRTIPAQPDPNNASAEPGIYDVKSGSDQLSLDGTPYAEWE